MRDFVYTPSPTVTMTFSEAMAHTPREDMVLAAIHVAWSAAVRAAVRAWFRLRVLGREHVPGGGGFLVVANHSSHADEVVLQATLPLRSQGRVLPVVAQDYWFTSPLRSFLSAALLNALPVDRREPGRHSLEACEELLASGDDILIVFPEGTRSADGKMQPFRRGAGWLVAGRPYPVLPAYIRGAHEAWPKGSHIPRPRRIEVRVGETLLFDDLARDRDGFTRATERMEAAVRELGREGTEVS